MITEKLRYQPRVLYVQSGKKRSLARDIGEKFSDAFLPPTQAYFESALRSAFRVTFTTSAKVLARSEYYRKHFDILVVNYSLDHHFSSLSRDELCVELVKQLKLPAVLVYGSDKATSIPNNKVVDHYDLLFKREPYLDRSVYKSLNEKNRAKIRPTMLACPIEFSYRWLPFRVKEKFLGQDKQEKEYDCDVFFAGRLTPANNERERIWLRMHREAGSFRLCGGLWPHYKQNKSMLSEYVGIKLSPFSYADKVRHSKINLALEGAGEFTFRHLEIWCLGGFMISSPSIRKLELPLPAKEGVHYVCYDDEDDLVEKVRFYIGNDGDRELIARAGKEMFNRWYSPRVHSKDIADELTNL